MIVFVFVCVCKRVCVNVEVPLSLIVSSHPPSFSPHPWFLGRTLAWADIWAELGCSGFVCFPDFAQRVCTHKETEKQKHRHTGRRRQTDTQTDTQNTHTHTDTHKETDTHTHTHRQKHKHKHTNKRSHTCMHARRYEATTQGISAGLFWGLGYGLGACGGGFVNQARGYVFLFFLASAVTASACVIGQLWYFFESRFSKRPEPDQAKHM